MSRRDACSDVFLGVLGRESASRFDQGFTPSDLTKQFQLVLFKRRLNYCKYNIIQPRTRRRPLPMGLLYSLLWWKPLSISSQVLSQVDRRSKVGRKVRRSGHPQTSRDQKGVVPLDLGPQ